MTKDPKESPQKSSQSDEVTLGNKKNISLILLAAAWLIPFLWPFAIAGTIGMFPKTSKRIGFGALTLAGVAFLTVTANGILKSNEQKKQEESTSTSQAVEEQPSSIAEPNRNGNRIADRLEEECDY